MQAAAASPLLGGKGAGPRRCPCPQPLSHASPARANGPPWPRGTEAAGWPDSRARARAAVAPPFPSRAAARRVPSAPPSARRRHFRPRPPGPYLAVAAAGGAERNGSPRRAQPRPKGGGGGAGEAAGGWREQPGRQRRAAAQQQSGQAAARCGSGGHGRRAGAEGLRLPFPGGAGRSGAPALPAARGRGLPEGLLRGRGSGAAGGCYSPLWPGLDCRFPTRRTRGEKEGAETMRSPARGEAAGLPPVPASRAEGVQTLRETGCECNASWLRREQSSAVQGFTSYCCFLLT